MTERAGQRYFSKYFLDKKKEEKTTMSLTTRPVVDILLLPTAGDAGAGLVYTHGAGTEDCQR